MTATLIPAVVRQPLRASAWTGRWLFNHWTGGLICVSLALIAQGAGLPRLALSLVVAPVVAAVVLAFWAFQWPVSFERWWAGPLRRRGWRRFVRKDWKRLCADCRLSVRQTNRHGDVNYLPGKRRVRARGHTLTMQLRAARSQTLEEMESGVQRLAATLGAQSYRTWHETGSWIGVEFVMVEGLRLPRSGGDPDDWSQVDAVPMGRSESGEPWVLPVLGRHTLTVGASGSGKGSVLWGMCCNYGRGVRSDMVRLWGIDLARGVELGMGRSLFYAFADKPADALLMLRELRRVIDDRAPSMAGATRLHTPSPGDPIHLLVIDELAILTAYGDREVRREASDLLSEILTQGRKFNVLVAGFVQDPRREVVGMRQLFTQTVSLRLRSVEETVMVLGEGMAKRAPAHRISPTQQGTGYVVNDDGSVLRVRADFWSDKQIRRVAQRYAAPKQLDMERVRVEQTRAEQEQKSKSERKPRSPRKPRQPRRPRQGDSGQEES